jgi:simple sugar transport system permease protein
MAKAGATERAKFGTDNALTGQAGTLSQARSSSEQVAPPASRSLGAPEGSGEPSGAAGAAGRLTSLGGSGLGSRLLRQREAGIVVVGVALFAIFSVLSSGSFDSVQTWGGISSTASELGIVTVGVTLLMICGEFDLSVGANFSFAALVMAMMLQDHHNTLLALLTDLAIGAGIGLLNGVVTVFLAIPSFITTLGTFFLWTGITLIVTGGETVTILPPAPSVLNVLGGQLSGQVRVEVLWWLGLALLVGVVLQRTVIGNWFYAVGGKRTAAVEAGVPVRRTRIVAFVICGVFAGFAGAVQLGHLGSMSASFGTTYQLEAIAAAVVGGTALAGGRGSMLGAVVGTVMLEMLDSGLILSGVSPYWYEAVIGAILILAVAMHTRIGQIVRGAEA